MAVREMLNQNGAVVAVGAIAIIAAVVIVVGRRDSNQSGAIKAKAFFTDDDGKTWFVDDAAKLTPFDHDGKPAVQCFVYRTDKGNMFVACEAELPDAVRKALLKESTPTKPARMPANARLLLKRPGSSEWQDGDTVAASIFQHITAPDGSAGVKLVSPSP